MSSLIRRVSIATWTSVEPVSVVVRPVLVDQLLLGFLGESHVSPLVNSSPRSPHAVKEGHGRPRSRSRGSVAAGLLGHQPPRVLGGSDTVSRVLPPPLRLLRLANPVVRAVLGSPAHRLLSGTARCVLEYRGRRSGRTLPHPPPLRRDPATEARRDRRASLTRKLWWRVVRRPSDRRRWPCAAPRRVVGTLAEGERAKQRSTAYVAR